MAPIPPSVRRQRVGAELKRIREQRGMSMREVAAALGDFSVSKLSRIESGKGGIKGDDVYTLCEHYGLSSQDADKLVARTRQTRGGTWWHEFGPDVLGRFADFIELELDARQVYEFEEGVIPGHYQTSHYAAAVIRSGRPDLSDEVIEQRVTLRIERQRRRAAEAQNVWAILDEAALLRPVGGPEVMADQLAHLSRLARSPGTTVQVIPLATPGHAALGCPFTIMTLMDGVEYVYRDGKTGGTYTDDADEVSVYRETWSRLTATAADFDRSLGMINRAEAKHRSAADAHDDTL